MPAKWQTWMPKVIDAWCGSRNVQGLSDAAYRAYDNLLMAEWQSEDGSLPSDDKYLAKASAMFGRWADVKDEVLEMFQREGTRIFSPRLRQEWQRAQTVHAKKSAGGGDNNKQSDLDFEDNGPNRRADSAKSRSGVRYTATATSTTTSTKPQNQIPRAEPRPFNLLNPLDNVEVESMINRIAVAHPRNQMRGTQISEVVYGHQAAIIQAMKDEMARTEAAPMVCLQMILDRVELHAAEVSPERYQFFKDLPRYFALHEYRLEPSHFNREDRNNGNQSKGDSTMAALKRSLQAGHNQSGFSEARG